MNDGAARPLVGIGVLVLREGKVLLGLRVSGHGAGTYTLPGGHLESGETFEDAARREVAEETGLTDLVTRGLVSVSNDVAYEKHYVTIAILAESTSGNPVALELEKVKDWEWYDPEHLPAPMFLPSSRTIENWIAGRVYEKVTIGPEA